MIVPIVFIVLAIWMPESPRWLIMKGRHEEAHLLLRRLHRSPSDHDDSFADVEYYQISKQADIDASLNLSYKEMVSNRPMLLRTLFGIIWPAMTATSGVNVVVSKYRNIIPCLLKLPKCLVSYSDSIQAGVILLPHSSRCWFVHLLADTTMLQSTAHCFTASSASPPTNSSSIKEAGQP